VRDIPTPVERTKQWTQRPPAASTNLDEAVVFCVCAKKRKFFRAQTRVFNIRFPSNFFRV
jgi:hypothetical protein